MEAKKLYAAIYLKNEKAYTGLNAETVFDDEPAALAKHYSEKGIDGILVFDLSDTDREHDAAIGLLKEIVRSVEVPVFAGGNIKRMEDVKKLLYAGASKAFLNFSKASDRALTKEVTEKFGAKKILACIKANDPLSDATALPGGLIALDADAERGAIEGEAILLITERAENAWLSECEKALKDARYQAAAGGFLNEKETSYAKIRAELSARDIPMKALKSRLAFSELTVNADGLIPVIVQDYKNGEVLQLAYMNEEAFENTQKTGLMTYYSRSRKCQWVKGETSGHFQYVKELTADCDKDTLLAKVSQVGAACHTGARSCFFENLFTTEYNRTNPHKVLEDVYATIADRKAHPKEGSYTNYLFDKGIDKILKKVGEEATEIVIAAKNPDAEEIKYEMADFLYHAMVLMVERDVTWEDIARELAERH